VGLAFKELLSFYKIIRCFDGIGGTEGAWVST
jgi:hypothetical protein